MLVFICNLFEECEALPPAHAGVLTFRAAVLPPRAVCFFTFLNFFHVVPSVVEGLPIFFPCHSEWSGSEIEESHK